VYLPRQVTDFSAKRVENEVVVQFTVPTLNTDGSGPADLRRVEVYAHTGPLPTPADFLKYGTIVSSIDIASPPEPGPAEPEEKPANEGEAVPKQETIPAATAGPTLTEQGWLISVREMLTDKHREIGPMPPTRPLPPPLPNAPVIERLETPGTVNFELPPTRFYTAVGVSRSRGRRGPYAGPLRVPLLDPLSAPEKVDVAYTEAAISLTWPAQPEDSRAPVAASVAPAAETTPPAAEPPASQPVPQVRVNQETAGTVELFADVETDGTEDVLRGRAAAAPAVAAKPPPAPAPRFGYNVYDAISTPNAPAESGAPVAPVMPLNKALLTVTTFSDPRVEFGVERCYLIRRVEMAGSIAIESAPTAPICVTPVDTFSPAAPKNLQAISGGAGVSLLWEANAEVDFGGYLVLRAEAPDDKLSPLTPAPIADTSFNDTTVRRGRTYVYEVVAVDKSMPANQSAPSNRVEETIR
jgi:hypothetical protein